MGGYARSKITGARATDGARSARRLLARFDDRTPRLDGAVTVDGPSSRVRIRRDGNGVPHIEAGDDRDAWFGLGFAIGQDRTFQLEFYRRAVSGTMSAAVGKRALPHDRFVRRIGYRRAAEQQYLGLDAPTRGLLSAYAAGINAGQTQGRRRKSLEHALLGLRPHPWTAVDSLAFVKLITASLSTNWDTELARLLILESDGPDALAAVDARYGEHHPVTSPVGIPAGVINDLRDDIVRHQRWLPTAGGSNNWAVDASRTASGRPIVANDPHLNPQVPAQWYLAHVSTPDWSGAGATLAGAPGFIVGHNGHVAWGVTAGRADLSDLVVETLSSDGRSVLRPHGWVECTEEYEVIEVRGGSPVVERVLVTDTGPVVSPAIDDAPVSLSLRATWLEPGPLRGFFDAGRQTDVDGLVETFRSWNGPNVNLVAADETTIGWKYVANAPLRTTAGRVPARGAASVDEWPTERVPFDELPQLVGPGDGLVATANNQPLPDGEGPELGSEWSDGYRVHRIQRVLRSRHDWTADDFAQLQLDQLVGAWEEIGAVFTEPAHRSGDARLAARILRDWDGQASATSIAASVFELATHNLTVALMEHLAPSSATTALGAPVHSLAPFNGLVVRRSSWLVDQVASPPPGFDLPGAVERSLEVAVADLRRRRGADPGGWAWGRVRPLRIHHLLHEVPGLGRVLGLGPLSTGGTINTVAMCASGPLDPLADPVAMANMRMVVEVGNWDAAAFVLAGGQSGDPSSRHYDDQLGRWLRGESITVPWSPAAVDAAVEHELVLVPSVA